MTPWYQKYQVHGLSLESFIRGLLVSKHPNNTAWWCNNHLEKYEFVNGKDFISHILWKTKTCFKPPSRYYVDTKWNFHQHVRWPRAMMIIYQTETRRIDLGWGSIETPADFLL